MVECFFSTTLLTGLKSADYNGFSDPYCKISMAKAKISRADKEKSTVIKFKSKVGPVA